MQPRKGGLSIRDLADGRLVYDILSSRVGYDPKEYAPIYASMREEGLFPLLVAIILSQNTNDKNAIAAFEELRAVIGVTVEALSKADPVEIGEAIKKAGLYRQKAKAIAEVARLVRDRGGENYLRNSGAREIRELLLGIKGIGRKTVDVFLAVTGKDKVFAVDTHAFRIARRWGLVGPRASYEETSRALLEFFGPDVADEAHRLIISLGRKYCTARNPRCPECPLRDVCPHALKG
ncbi:MAG: endonuclease III [Desulfurococcales archaeon]|nr:endonuclease III [Desulfurococcales archaeon]